MQEVMLRGKFMQSALLDEKQLEPIRPINELGAYEALWAEEGATFKRIADKFRGHPGYLPSSFVPEEKAASYRDQVLKLIEKAGIKKFGIRINGTRDYIPKLRQAKHPIELFYFQGNWELAYSKSVAIVGTRKPTKDGLNRAHKLAQLLVKDDITITSGLAQGIDTQAHLSALKAGGRTFAVIGTPLTHFYPKENANLQKILTEYFLVISQVPFVRYSMQTPLQNRFFFPERNKLMSAITEATVIIEAGETSGTLIQARAALEQGRKLFILDSCFKNPDISWPQKFEKKGAIRVTDYDQIREGL